MFLHRLTDRVIARATPQRSLLVLAVAATAAVTAAGGLVLGQVSREEIRADAVAQAQRGAETLGNFIFDGDAFTHGAPTPQSLRDLRDLLGEASDLSGLRLVDTSGTVLFDSLKPELVGRRTERSDLKQPLRGEATTEITSLAAERAANEGPVAPDQPDELLEVNLPVGGATGSPHAVLSVYTSYAPVGDAVAVAGRITKLVMLGAGLLLFAFLVPPLLRASRRFGGRTDTRTPVIQRALDRAIKAGELSLHYQPKVACATGRTTGVEALVRWNDPRRGQISPGEFIPAAERDQQLIERLTLHVVELACAQSAAWRADGISLPISINFSARNLHDADLPRKVLAILKRHGAYPEHFVIEVTESATMDDFEASRLTLAQLSAAGFQISIDDFGTGHSSLGRLGTLPIDELKIDRRFISEMSAGASGAVVRAITSIAHEFGLRVTAEGVEDQETLERLAQGHCDEVQGFHICRPVPAPLLIEWLARNEPGLSSAGDGRTPHRAVAGAGAGPATA
jgi:EAL domain-containing protein (putative c-di-GMP-specific phosphodiesterase class I)